MAHGLSRTRTAPQQAVGAGGASQSTASKSDEAQKALAATKIQALQRGKQVRHEVAPKREKIEKLKTQITRAESYLQCVGVKSGAIDLSELPDLHGQRLETLEQLKVDRDERISAHYAKLCADNEACPLSSMMELKFEGFRGSNCWTSDGLEGTKLARALQIFETTIDGIVETGTTEVSLKDISFGKSSINLHGGTIQLVKGGIEVLNGIAKELKPDSDEKAANAIAISISRKQLATHEVGKLKDPSNIINHYLGNFSEEERALKIQALNDSFSKTFGIMIDDNTTIDTIVKTFANAAQSQHDLLGEWLKENVLQQPEMGYYKLEECEILQRLTPEEKCKQDAAQAFFDAGGAPPLVAIPGDLALYQESGVTIGRDMFSHGEKDPAHSLSAFNALTTLGGHVFTGEIDYKEIANILNSQDAGFITERLTALKTTNPNVLLACIDLDPETATDEQITAKAIELARKEATELDRGNTLALSRSGQILNSDAIQAVKELNNGIVAATTFCIQAMADQTPAGGTAEETKRALEAAKDEVAAWLSDEDNQAYIKRFSTLAIGPSSPFAGFNPTKTIRPAMAACENATDKLNLMKKQFTHYMNVFESLQTYTSLTYPDTDLTPEIIQNDDILKALFEKNDMGMSQQAYGQLYEALCAGEHNISDGKIKGKLAVSLMNLGTLDEPSKSVEGLNKAITTKAKAATTIQAHFRERKVRKEASAGRTEQVDNLQTAQQEAAAARTVREQGMTSNE